MPSRPSLASPSPVRTSAPTSAPSRGPRRRGRADLVRLALAALLVVPAACDSLPHSKNVFRDRTESQAPDKLAEKAPSDILIAPVRNQTDRDDVPVDLLRSALHDALVGRLYSPLDLAYADAHWAESTYRGEDVPDAVLVASITHWSTSGLSGQGTMEIGVDLRLFSGGSTAGEVLWSAQVDRIVKVVQGGDPPYGPEDRLVARGAEIWAPEALSALPERDPLAGIGH